MLDLAEDLWPDNADSGGDTLMIDGISMEALACEYGTPLYVVDVASIRRRVVAYESALHRHYGGTTRVHYAAKAYISAAMVALLTKLGCGFDVSSFAEAAVVEAGGGSLKSSHLHGNAKPDNEIRLGLEAGIGSIVIDNVAEVERLASIAAQVKVMAPVLVRVSPGTQVETHPHIMTGHRDAKFGVPLDQLDVVGSAIARSPVLDFKGLHFHLGSQLLSPAGFQDSIDVTVAAAARLTRSQGLETRVLSPGGGLGIAYTGKEDVPTIDDFVRVLATAVERSSAKHDVPLPELALEPGRSIVGPAMIAIYRVLGSKSLSTGRRVIHVDGGMGDNPRPALYGSELSPVVVDQGLARHRETVDIAGRYCESSDVICRDVQLPTPHVGDLVAIPSAGAYTVSMASNYNGALRPAVVAIDAGQALLWQRRETHDDLLRRDVMPVGMNP